MTNEYGLDYSYFTKKLKLIQRNIKNYKPAELARELARLSKTADAKVLAESEFNSVIQAPKKQTFIEQRDQIVENELKRF